ncbi:hypothetical protein D3C84_1122270 [compost metagenome]
MHHTETFTWKRHQVEVAVSVSLVGVLHDRQQPISVLLLQVFDDRFPVLRPAVIWEVLGHTEHPSSYAVPVDPVLFALGVFSLFRPLDSLFQCL